VLLLLLLLLLLRPLTVPLSVKRGFQPYATQRKQCT